MKKIPHEHEVRKLLARPEFKAIRVGGYVATCPSHDPGHTGQVRPWNTTDNYLMPKTCMNEDEYADALAHATRAANIAHKRTQCTTELAVTLNVS